MEEEIRTRHPGSMAVSAVAGDEDEDPRPDEEAEAEEADEIAIAIRRKF